MAGRTNGIEGQAGAFAPDKHGGPGQRRQQRPDQHRKFDHGFLFGISKGQQADEKTHSEADAA